VGTERESCAWRTSNYETGKGRNEHCIHTREEKKWKGEMKKSEKGGGDYHFSAGGKGNEGHSLLQRKCDKNEGRRGACGDQEGWGNMHKRDEFRGVTRTGCKTINRSLSRLISRKKSKKEMSIPKEPGQRAN